MFRALLVVLITAFVLSAAAVDQPVRPTPIVRTLAPTPVKIGEELVATGQHLGKDFVSSVYLTMGEDTFQVTIKSQTEEEIRFTVPAGVKTGRFGLMVLTHGDVPRYIDEPVFVTIE